MANDEVAREIVESIQQRLEPNERDKVKLDSVRRILASLMDEQSPHYYVTCISQEAGLSDDALKFRTLAMSGAKSVFPHLHAACGHLLPENKPCFGKTFCEYMVCEKGETNDVVVQKHSQIMKMLKNQVLRAKLVDRSDKVGTLLGLTYWLHMFFCEKRAKGHRDYNKYKSLHNFLADLILTLVGLICLIGVPPTYNTFTVNGEEIPNFQKIIPHICISPEHPAFQRHILKRMLGIITEKVHGNGTLENLAETFCSEFKHFTNPCVRLKSHETVLKIVIDQSRYLALCGKELRRNFVAYRTITCASMILELKHAASKVKDIFVEERRGTLSDEKCINWLHEIHKCMCSPGPVDFSYFPALPIDGRPSSERDSIIKPLNGFHHQLLCNAAVCVLGVQNIPKINEQGRFVVEDFMEFVKNLARTVITRNTPHEDLAPLVISLQLIIGVRWYVNEAVKRPGIEMNEITQEHQDVVFLLMAFRAILMYRLPSNTSDYGVQPFSRDFPYYARQIKLDLHLDDP